MFYYHHSESVKGFGVAYLSPIDVLFFGIGCSKFFIFLFFLSLFFCVFVFVFVFNPVQVDSCLDRIHDHHDTE